MNADTLMESAVLSDIISGSTLTDQIFSELVEDNFDNHKNKALFKILQGMYSDKLPIDLLTVMHRLLSDGTENGLVDHLKVCLDHTTTPAHVLTYIGIVKRNSYLRKIRNEILRLNPEVGHESIDLIMNLIQLRDNGDRKTTVRPDEFMEDYIKDLKTNKCAGVDTGFPSIDRNIHSQASDLIVVGARTNVGKTTFLTNVLVNMLKNDIPCLYCPTEMQPAQFMDRIAPIVVNIPADKFRSREFDLRDTEQIGNIQELVASMPLTLLNIASPTIHEVRMAVKASGCKVFFLDYLGRCSMPREVTRMREIERFMVELKNICVEMKVLCFLAAQLSRVTDFNKNTEPRLADLSDSSAIEKEADAVVFLWRDDSAPGSFDVPTISGVLGKNRHGRLPAFKVDFNKHSMKMSEQGHQPKAFMEDYGNAEEVSF